MLSETAFRSSVGLGDWNICLSCCCYCRCLLSTRQSQQFKKNNVPDIDIITFPPFLPPHAILVFVFRSNPNNASRVDEGSRSIL